MSRPACTIPKTQSAAGDLLATVEKCFKRYLALDSGLPLVLALWSLATHVFSCFDAFPYLAITSPTKRCGKTRLAEIVELLCCNGLRTVGATPAVIFRTVQAQEQRKGTVTLIMDEAEVLGGKSDRSESLREILNAGYRQGQYVLRCERTAENGFDVQKFTVYCPKVIILIGNLSDTLADRCIPIAMRRRKPGEHVERFFYAQAKRETQRIRKDSESWAKSSHQKVKKHLKQDAEFLEDREAELWAPLFGVCAAAAPERIEHLKAIALRVSGAKQSNEPDDMGVLLLKDIREVFGRSQQNRLPTFDLLNALSALGESPWATWSRGAALDARRLAKLLRPFKVMPHNLRLDGDKIVKGYQFSDFEEVWATYLPSDSTATALQGS